MMPTIHRSPINLPPHPAPLPDGQATAAPAAGAPRNPPHFDYNHQPLLVSGLDHYVKPEEGERFHVS